MDPNANLKEQLEMAKAIIATWDRSDNFGHLSKEATEEVASQAEELARLVIALNEWITKGGFLPIPWHGRAQRTGK